MKLMVRWVVGSIFLLDALSYFSFQSVLHDWCNKRRGGLNPFWPHKFGFKPLLGLEPMAPIRPQLQVSHANYSATETSMYVCMYVCMY